ncbi:MAG: hypothetical protein GWP30_11615 [Actinobacteria bacterium]|nr:hypothetical protein [Actinomycetota bacterium]
MKKFIPAIVLFSTLISFDIAIAEPEYTRVEMEVDVEASADVLWAIAGGYCDISVWANIKCEITSGDGNMGTVRVLLDGAITEIMVAKTALSYGYTQPVKEGQYYDLYHGFMEARPVTDNSSKLIYTLVYDVSNFPDQAAKDTSIARRRAQFDQLLLNIKMLAEK